MISSANLSTMLVLPISTVTSAPRLLGFGRVALRIWGIISYLAASPQHRHYCQ